MNKNFIFNSPEGVQPVVFETIFAEKNGGGMLPNQTRDIPVGTAIGINASGKFEPLKAFVVVEDAASNASSIKIAKGSGAIATSVVGVGSKAVAATAISKTNDAYDTLTISLGVAVKKGQILYEAAEASSDSAVPALTPVYLLGTYYPANTGDLEVKLVNGANIRKETAPVADEVVALMTGIHKI